MSYEKLNAKGEKVKIIDMRSDTVTPPTQAMRDAMYNASVGDDVYDDDMLTIELERLAAEMTGKEAALFVPSGTFGNQLALFTHCLRGQEVILYDDCHIVEHEAGGAAYISGVQLRTIDGGGSNPSADEIAAKIRIGADDDIHKPYTGLICLETTHSDGKVVSLEALADIKALADSHNIPVHLDGARIFNAASYLGVQASEIAKYADSVMFCLSKGLCAPIGSMLVGSHEFIKNARRKRKIMGGGMRQTGILAAAGIVALKEMTTRLGVDRDHALHLAELLLDIDGLVVNIRDVHANLVYAHISDPELEKNIAPALEKKGILINPPEDGLVRFATHYWISREDVEFVARAVESV